jgi:uncharacterized protein YbjQ (UPF0145 family)
MPQCKKCNLNVSIADIDLFSKTCSKCRNAVKQAKRSNSLAKEYNKHLENHPLPNHDHLTIPMTTTENFPRHDTSEIKKVVFAEVVMGVNYLKDIKAFFTDTLGGRSLAYESELSEGRSIAVSELKYNAYKAGANCIIGCRVDYEIIADKMFIITATGTAIVATPK